jgi:phage gp46-like protein
MPLDIALAYDPVNRRTDVVFTGRDFALDNTWQTPVLMCLGCQRRAHPDDAVPQPTETLPADAPLMNTRGGWPGDALDPYGELTGSRQWIFSRSKLDAAVVKQVLAADTEALQPLTGRLGVQMQITVQRVGRNTVAHRVIVGKQEIVVPQVVGS